MNSQSAEVGTKTDTEISWTALAPAAGSRIWHRAPLKRLVKMVEASRADRNIVYTFAGLLENVRPPSPEWLALVLSRLLILGKAQLVFVVRSPDGEIPLKEYHSLDAIPRSLPHPFSNGVFTPRLKDVDVLLRFCDSALSRIAGTNLTLGEKIAKSKYERIGEGLRDFPMNVEISKLHGGLEDDEIAASFLLAIATKGGTETDPTSEQMEPVPPPTPPEVPRPVSKATIKMGCRRRLGFLILFLLILTLLSLAILVLFWEPTSIQLQVLGALVAVELGGEGFCFWGMIHVPATLRKELSTLVVTVLGQVIGFLIISNVFS